VILNEDLRTIEMTQFNSEYIVAAKVRGQNDRHAITVVSAYFKYNMPTSCFVEKLRVILESEKHVMIGADVNAHSKLWHCPSRNDRGRLVEEMIEDYDLRVVNRPSELRTYDRDGMGCDNSTFCIFVFRFREVMWSPLDYIGRQPRAETCIGRSVVDFRTLY